MPRRPPATHDSEPPLPSRRRRRLTGLAAFLVGAAVVAASIATLWWRSDGQRLDRAVAGIGDLPGVSSTSIRTEDGHRHVRISLADAATTPQACAVLRRTTSSAVLMRLAFDLYIDDGGADLRLDAATSHPDPITTSECPQLAGPLVALRSVSPGRAGVSRGGFVTVASATRTRLTPAAGIDQARQALALLDRAGVASPRILYVESGDHTASAQVDAGPADLSAVLGVVRSASTGGVTLDEIDGDLLRLRAPGTMPDTELRARLRRVAAAVGPIRHDGEPVIRQVTDGSIAVRVPVN